jgi:hypothetical protein
VEWILAIGEELGLHFQEEKTFWPCSLLDFLGLDLGSDVMEAQLPEDKLLFLRDLLRDWSRKHTCSLREVQELVSFLQFSLQVIP